MKLFAAALNFAPVAEEFGLSRQFPDEVTAAAAAATDQFADQRSDATHLPLVTIDPPGSRDLDQAVYIARDGAGFRVYYAIADVAAFITPGDPVDVESHLRGQTLYLPDEPVRLHPAALSENKASLLPEVQRPAVLWSVLLSEHGDIEEVDVTRVNVRSRARLDYAEVQAGLDGRVALHPSLEHFAAVGRARMRHPQRAEAINLRLPSQRVSSDGAGIYQLEFEPHTEAHAYNAEISLLTGICAGTMAVQAGFGFLRTLGPATEESTARFRESTAALGDPWEEYEPVGRYLARVKVETPAGMAIMRQATGLLKGADYHWLSLGAGEEITARHTHTGIGGVYAHATAPLRRLVDRYVSEVCLAVAAARRAGSQLQLEDLPEWVTAEPREVVDVMRKTSQLASRVEKACLALAEATVLQPFASQHFTATVLHAATETREAEILLADPAVMAPCEGAPPLGTRLRAQLLTADPATRTVRFRK